MNDLVFETPRNEGRRGRPKGEGKWLKLLLPLLEFKGQWVRIGLFDTPNEAYNRRGQLKSGDYTIPPGEWNFATEKKGDGSGWGLYAIYLGEVGDEREEG